ncbi:TPA: LCP family protein, partial [Streptococcus suis]
MKKRSRWRESPKLKLVNFALWVLYAIILCLFLVTMYRYNILDFRYLNYIVTILLIGVAVLTGLLMWRKKARIFTALVLIFSLVITSVGIYGMQEVVKFSTRLNSNSAFSEYEMSILVPVNSEITDVRQVTNVLAPAEYDQDNITALLNDISKMESTQLTTSPTTSYLTAYQAMLNGESQAMVFNGVFTNILENE